MAGMGKPQLQDVYAALSVMYQNKGTGTPAKKSIEDASTYLSQVQQSVWAWELADTLLMENKAKENSNFAATMLRNKIQKEFRQLPAESHVSLQQSLLKHLELYREAGGVLVTKLSLALADLALQMFSWKSVVPDLVTRFSPDPRSWDILLECLTVMPEEVGSRYLKLGAARREEVTTQLQSHSGTVFAFLEFVISNCHVLGNPATCRNRVFKCWGSWLVLGEFDASAVSKGKILSQVFEIAVKSPSTDPSYEAACEAICSSTYAMEDLHVNSELALQIVPRLATLQGPLVTAISNGNVDIVNHITRILTEAGESLIAPLTKTPGQGLGDLHLVTLILTAIQYHDYSVAESSFSFWFQLAEHIYRAPDNTTVEVFKPVFVQLLTVLVKLSELYEEFDENSFDDEDFLDFREKCSELLKETVYIVGTRQVLELLITEVDKTTPSSWQRLEALLFCSSCVIKMLSKTDTDLVFRYLRSALGIPATANMNLRVISVRIIGECAEWVIGEEEALHRVLEKLLSDLKEKKLTKHCIKTLEKLCNMGGAVLWMHVELLIQIIEQAVDLPQTIFTQFIECVTGVCCYHPLPKQTELLARIAGRSITALSTKQPETAINEIDCLSSLFRGYKGDVAPTDKHPLQGVLVTSWPHLAAAMATYAASVNNIERVCRCIRYGLRSVGKRTPEILEPLAESLIQLYTVRPHSCVLYLSSVIVDEFSSDERLKVGLLGLFSAMGPVTFGILSAPHGLERNPDTVDDFYRLCSRYMQHLGDLLSASPIMPHLVDMSVMCLSLQHKDAQCSAIKFIDTVMNRATAEKCVLCSGHVTRKGGDMVSKIILGVSGGQPSSLITDLAILLHDLLSAFQEPARAWLRLALSTVPIGTYVTQQQVEDLYTSLTKADNLPRDTVRHCKEFNQCFT